MSTEHPTRFAFLHSPPPISRRLLALSMLALAVVLQLLLDSTTGFAVAIIIAIPAVVMLIKPPKPDFYVELTGSHLLVHALLTNRISLREVSSAEIHVPRYNTAWMHFENVLISFDRLFGGNFSHVPPPGKPDHRTVEVKFRKRVPILLPFPPFIWPRTNWLLRVEDAPKLRDLIQSRLTS